MDVELLPNFPGSYALVLRCETPFEVSVGRLGRCFFSDGYWIYTGSALGPGGLRARLAHHLRPSPRPHWHLDYLKPAMRPVETWITIGEINREHDWAACLAGYRGASRPIRGFGASDCSCRAHLIHSPRRPGFDGFRTRLRKTNPSHPPLSRFTAIDFQASRY